MEFWRFKRWWVRFSGFDGSALVQNAATLRALGPRITLTGTVTPKGSPFVGMRILSCVNKKNNYIYNIYHIYNIIILYYI